MGPNINKSLKLKEHPYEDLFSSNNHSSVSASCLNAWAQADKDVKVINNPANPVPVNGTVTISGTPSVAINGTVAVRNIDGPLEPFRALYRAKFLLEPGSAYDLLYTVPAGKRLVIEHISFLSEGWSSGELEYVSLVTEREGVTEGEFYCDIHPPYAGFNQTGSQSVKVYVEAGEDIYLRVHATTADRNFRVTIYGYLITL